MFWGCCLSLQWAHPPYESQITFRSSPASGGDLPRAIVEKGESWLSPTLNKLALIQLQFQTRPPQIQQWGGKLDTQQN